MNRIENILSASVFKKIQKEVFSNDFPWYYASTAYASNSNSMFDFSFSHAALGNEGKSSFIKDVLETAILSALDKTNQTVNCIYRIRLGMTTINVPHIDHPHVDLKFPHMTGLIYLNDADSPTILYNEFYDPASALEPDVYYKNVLNNEVTVKEKNIPKENSMIWFNGFNYHSSSLPTTTSRRIVLNFNYN
jgi:hypothetical protein